MLFSFCISWTLNEKISVVFFPHVVFSVTLKRIVLGRVSSQATAPLEFVGFFVLLLLLLLLFLRGSVCMFVTPRCGGKKTTRSLTLGSKKKRLLIFFDFFRIQQQIDFKYFSRLFLCTLHSNEKLFLEVSSNLFKIKFNLLLFCCCGPCVLLFC